MQTRHPPVLPPRCSRGGPLPMLRIPIAALALAACAPALISNQTFLVPEELKLAPNAYASLKSTGETFDLGAIKQEEAKTDRIDIIKIHGTYLLVGDGYRHSWQLWPGGKDEMHYKPLKLEPGAQGFSAATPEASGNCALLNWQKGPSPGQAYVNAAGEALENRRPPCSGFG